MNAFKKVTQLKEDYDIAHLQLMSAHNDARDIVNAVSSRLEADIEQTDSRAAKLEAQAADTERSETVRRVASMELSKLRLKTFSPTEEEAAAFGEQIELLREARRDALNVQEKMSSAIIEAEQALKEIQSAVVGDESIMLSERWAEGLQEAFNKLCAEAKK